MHHHLKSWPLFFRPIVHGLATFTVRRADREFAVGDTVTLREWVPVAGHPGNGGDYTGDVAERRISYILDPWLHPSADLGLQHGFVILGLTVPPTKETS